MMSNTIRNVYCVGRNYRLHAAELGNEVPDEPMIFMKPSHALVPLSGQTIHVPFRPGELHYEAELVLHIGRNYEQGMRAEELIDQVALGIDFTLRDLQSVLKKKGHPWLPAKGFLQSAPVTAFHPVADAGNLGETSYTLDINGKEVQRGCTVDMIFDFQVLIEYCAQHYGLGKGDLLFTGTPAGVGAVTDGDHFTLKFGGATWGEFTVKYDG